MFASVGCAECGKLFQVGRDRLGQPADCPWCGAKVLALPVAAKPGGEPEPLPLPLPEPVAVSGVGPVRKRRSRKWSWIAALLLCVPVAGGTFLIQRYRAGAMPSFVMQTHRAPDGSCQATLPGPAEEVAAPSFTPLQTGASLYASGSWLTRARGGLGWIDLDPERARMTRAEDLLGNVRDELGRWLGEPTVDKEGQVRSGQSDGLEVRFGTGGRRFTARLLAALDGPRPRVYLVWVGGPRFDPDGDAAARVLASFRVAAPAK